jgi:hypothetical protein
MTHGYYEGYGILDAFQRLFYPTVVERQQTDEMFR